MVKLFGETNRNAKVLSFDFEKKPKASKMVQWAKNLTVKSDDLISIPETMWEKRPNF